LYIIFYEYRRVSNVLFDFFYRQFLCGVDYHNFLLSLNFWLDYDKLFF